MAGLMLNLGCGSMPEDGYVNVDIWPQPGVDVVHNLDVFPWPWEDGSVERIISVDVYEHVDHPIEFMGECYRILEPGGILYIHTAYWKARSSYTDPTHKRYLTESSFDYWIVGTEYHKRFGAAYARGAKFEKIDIHLDIVGVGDLNVTLRKL